MAGGDIWPPVLMVKPPCPFSASAQSFASHSGLCGCCRRPGAGSFTEAGVCLRGECPRLRCPGDTDSDRSGSRRAAGPRTQDQDPGLIFCLHYCRGTAGRRALLRGLQQRWSRRVAPPPSHVQHGCGRRGGNTVTESWGVPPGCPSQPLNQ